MEHNLLDLESTPTDLACRDKRLYVAPTLLLLEGTDPQSGGLRAHEGDGGMAFGDS